MAITYSSWPAGQSELQQGFTISPHEDANVAEEHIMAFSCHQLKILHLVKWSII